MIFSEKNEQITVWPGEVPVRRDTLEIGHFFILVGVSMSSWTVWHLKVESLQ